jgi:hypothetical protein
MITHGQASTDKLLKNHGLNGSRHNGGHTPPSPLILLMFFNQVIPRAMVLQLMARSPRRSGFLVTVIGGSNPANLIPASRNQDHAISPSAGSAARLAVLHASIASRAPRS